jgi:hypothetical protein
MTTVILFLVGCVFLLTGVIKVVYSRPFIAHVRNLKILPRSLNEVAASLFIQLECGIGIALMMSIFTVELIPILIALILVLSILSAWGVNSGRVEDCGCYGGWLNLTLKQSLGLNFLYLLLLVISWWNLENASPVLMWKVWIIVGVIVLSNFLIRRSANSPLIDISPLRPGRRWKTKWSDFRELNGDRETRLVIFMTSRCQLCKSWEPYILNLIDQANMPLPILIFPDIVARSSSFHLFPLLKGAVGDVDRGKTNPGNFSAKDTKIWDEKIPQKIRDTKIWDEKIPQKIRDTKIWDEKIPQKIRDTKIWDEKIPLQIMKSGIFRYLIYQTPTAVLVRNGYVENKWVARFPEEYI